MKDLYNELVPVQHLKPAARTATVTPTTGGVDLRGYEGAVVEIDCGDWTDGTFVFEVQESDTNLGSSWSAVAAADLQGTEPTIDAADEDDVIHKLGYLGSKRYIAVAVTVTGSPSTGMVFGVTVIKGRAHHAV